MAHIQWFPGHMAKALRQLEEQLHLVDIVFELVDARIPMSSRNPEINRLIQNKPHLIILTKRDLADPHAVNQWLSHFRAQGTPAIAVDSRAVMTPKQITKISENILSERRKNDEAKGLKSRAIRAVVVGIPNVGKSTLLNHIVNRKVAQVGDRPGVTRNQQWLKSTHNLELLDTPGILWPKFDDQTIGLRLALTGAIKDSLFANDDVAIYGIDFFKEFHRDALKERYKLSDADLEQTTPDILLMITKKMGLRDDYDRGSERFILDVRHDKLGGYTLDPVNEVSDQSERN